MTQIPTAEEFVNDIKNIAYSQEEMMIVFAKFHVEEALKSAAENSKVRLAEDWIRKEETIYHGQLIHPITVRVEQESILNSYPLENIK